MDNSQQIEWAEININQLEDGTFTVYETLGDFYRECKTWEDVKKVIDIIIEETEKELEA